MCESPVFVLFGIVMARTATCVSLEYVEGKNINNNEYSVKIPHSIETMTNKDYISKFHPGSGDKRKPNTGRRKLII